MLAVRPCEVEAKVPEGDGVTERFTALDVEAIDMVDAPARPRFVTALV